MLLGDVLRRVTGEFLEVLAQRSVFDPICLRSPHMSWDESRAAHVVPILGGDFERLAPFNEREFLAMQRGDTGAYSNA